MPRVRSCRDRCSSLCRCTPEVIVFRPRRSGCVSVRYWSRRVCPGVLWIGVVRTGRRRRFRCGRFGCCGLPECVRFCHKRNGGRRFFGRCFELGCRLCRRYSSG
nr:MAG TPA: hypothetical protein [Caudoviricetes sp.]